MFENNDRSQAEKKRAAAAALLSADIEYENEEDAMLMHVSTVKADGMRAILDRNRVDSLTVRW